MKLKNYLYLTLIASVVFFLALNFFAGSLQITNDVFTGCTARTLSQANFEADSVWGFFNNLAVSVPAKPLAFDSQSRVLGDASADEKRIEISLAEQKLSAWQGNNKIMEFLISSGKWAPTPVGEYRIWTKLLYTRMKGGNKKTGTFYDLPNVPFTMYFHKGYGIHGAYWHDNFGQPMSHGCVNMRPSEAGILFNWADPRLPDNKTAVLADKNNPGTMVIVRQ